MSLPDPIEHLTVHLADGLSRDLCPYCTIRTVAGGTGVQPGDGLPIISRSDRQELLEGLEQLLRRQS